MSTTAPPSMNNRPKRPAVLVVSHADGFIECFSDRDVDVKLARMPKGHSREAERQAEKVMLDRLPKRYSELYRADMKRTSGTTRPLYPSVIEAVEDARTMIGNFARIENMATPVEGAAEAAERRLERARRAAR